MLEHKQTEKQRPKAPQLGQPAIVIAAFGSTRRGRTVFERFHGKVVEKYRDHDVFWAYTSKIIRQKTGGLGLRETLDHLAASGYLSAVIVPLQVFPGGEYQRIYDTADATTNIQITVGETLMHRQRYIEDVLAVVEKDFFSPEEGMNLLALHGTPVPADPVNGVYLSVEELVRKNYANVKAAALEGVPDYEMVFARIAAEVREKGYRRIRLIPMLLLAGMHVEHDLMGNDASWKTRLEQLGLVVECHHVEHAGERYFKSLASYPEVEHFYLQRLDTALQSLK